MRDQTRVPCIAKWVLNHWTTRKAQSSYILMMNLAILEVSYMNHYFSKPKIYWTSSSLPVHHVFAEQLWLLKQNTTSYCIFCSNNFFLKYFSCGIILNKLFRVMDLPSCFYFSSTNVVSSLNHIMCLLFWKMFNLKRKHITSIKNTLSCHPFAEILVGSTESILGKIYMAGWEVGTSQMVQTSSPTLRTLYSGKWCFMHPFCKRNNHCHYKPFVFFLAY